MDAAAILKVCKHGLRSDGFQEKQSWETDLACPSPSAALLPAGRQPGAQVCEKEAVLGLHGCNTDTLLPAWRHGCEAGTNHRSWLNQLDESLVNQGLEKMISLTPLISVEGRQLNPFQALGLIW